VDDRLGVHVETSLTTGTTTPDQRADYIKEVSRRLVLALGPGATLRGVALTEYKADAYGYEGITQAERYAPRHELA
jgi:4-oxalocrotonate tautomerase